MKFKILTAVVFSAVFLASCAKYIAPPFTSVDKIVKLKAGMTLNDVNTALNIEPYDVYFSEEDGSMVVTYNYRIKDRKMGMPTENKIRSEVGQKEGDPWYKTEWELLYVFYKDGKMKSAISDNGRSDAEFLLITNNNIEFITKNQLSSYGDKKIEVVPLDNKSRGEDKGLFNKMKKGRNKSKKSGD